MDRDRAVAAGLWSALDLALRQGVQFLVSIVLARLLTPAEFGIAALVSFFASLSIVFLQGGLSMALIQRRDSSRAEESAVFWLNLLASAVFALLLIAFAPAIAQLYRIPILVPLMGLAAAQIVFAALGAVQTALLSRQLRFDLLTRAGVFASLVSGAAGIAAALEGAGVWSLVIQLAVLAAMNSLALWVVSPWRPAFAFRMRDLGGLFRFGFALSLSSALDVIYTQGFALIVGKLHGVRDVGLYNRAQSTQLLPSNVIGSIVGRVAMPVFASRSDDRGALRRGIRLANGLTMMVNVPVMTGLMLLSDLVIRVLFGDQWPAAAPILSILALAGLVYPLHIINLQTLLAQGRSDLFLRLEIIKKTVGIGSIIVGSLFGLIGLAWSQVAFAGIGLAINVSPTKKSLGYGALKQLRDLGGIFIAAAIMAAVVLIVRPLVHSAPLIELLILTAVGAATYVAAGAAINGPDFRQAFDLAGQTLGRINNWRSRDVAR